MPVDRHKGRDSHGIQAGIVKNWLSDRHTLRYTETAICDQVRTPVAHDRRQEFWEDYRLPDEETSIHTGRKTERERKKVLQMDRWRAHTQANTYGEHA